MEGSMFIPADGSPLTQFCTDCGQAFQPRQVGDGVEELCDACYEARFQPRHSGTRRTPKSART
jgi:hypothetical protein